MAIFEGEKMVEEGKDETGVARDRGVADPFFFRPAAFALKGCGGPAIYACTAAFMWVQATFLQVIDKKYTRDCLRFIDLPGILLDQLLSF